MYAVKSLAFFVNINALLAATITQYRWLHRHKSKRTYCVPLFTYPASLQKHY